MFRGKSVAVVVPAYNEEGFVGDVIDSIPEFVDRIYAVDDCSTDGTWAEIRNREGEATARTDGGVTGETTDAGVRTGRGSNRSRTTAAAESSSGERQFGPRLTPIRHEENRGVGAAIKTGYRHALEDRMDVTAVINGDGQMDPSILDRFVEPIVEGDADYTKGNRLRAQSLYEEMSSWRLFGNVVLTLLMKISSGYWKMTDPQNGYTAISLDALEELDIDSLYDRYGFLNDLLIELNARGFRVADVSMKAIYGDEESGISYSTFVPTLSLLLFRGFFRRLKVKYLITDFHPLVLFYLLGTVGTLVGVAYAVWTYVASASVLAMGVSVLIVLLSAKSILFAMVFDMRNNEHLESTVSH